MSWSLSIPQQPFEEFYQAVHDAKLLQDTYNPPALVEQWAEQVEAARQAIYAILSCPDAFGRAEQGESVLWSATMTGHANHDGAGEGTGYTPSEFVHITLNRQPAPAPVPAGESK